MSAKKLLDDYVTDIQLQLREGNFNLALKEIQSALLSYPTNPKLYINGGNIYKLLGDIDNAELYFTKALSIHKSKEVLNNLSVIHIERRNYDQAISLAREAIEIDPAYVDAMYNLALSQDSLGNYDEAEKYSSKACSLNDYKDSRYLVLLIRILQNTCNWKDIDDISKMLDQHVGDGVEHPFLNISRTDNEEIKSLLNYEGEPFFKKKYRWKKAIPQYNLNQEELVEKIKEFQKNNPNFYITGNYFNGVSVSDCIEKASKLVEKFF